MAATEITAVRATTTDDTNDTAESARDIAIEEKFAELQGQEQARIKEMAENALLNDECDPSDKLAVMGHPDQDVSKLARVIPNC